MSRLTGAALLSSDGHRRPGGFVSALSLALDRLYDRAAREGMELVEKPRVTVVRRSWQEAADVERWGGRYLVVRSVRRRTTALRADALARPKK